MGGGDLVVEYLLLSVEGTEPSGAEQRVQGRLTCHSAAEKDYACPNPGIVDRGVAEQRVVGGKRDALAPYQGDSGKLVAAASGSNAASRKIVVWGGAWAAACATA